ncbi:hypothetical protein LINGRAHAP2_LOCUS32457 [Linum grandiflorum]
MTSPSFNDLLFGSLV